MTSQIMTVIFSPIKVFSAQFSCLIASFVGASVIGHGVMTGNIARLMLRFAKSLIADVRFDLKSHRTFESRNGCKMQVGGKTCHVP